MLVSGKNQKGKYVNSYLMALICVMLDERKRGESKIFVRLQMGISWNSILVYRRCMVQLALRVPANVVNS